MQEKNTNAPVEKKPDYPETGKQGGQGDIGKKGGDFGKPTEVGKPDEVKPVGKE